MERCKAKRKWIMLAAMLTVALIFAAGPTIAAEKMIEVKFSHVVADPTPKGQAALKFKEVLDKSGMFEVKVYPSSQLYGDKEELEAMRANNVQLIAPSMTKLVGFNPQFQIVDMPFLFSSENAVESFWASDMGREMFGTLRRAGFLGVAHWPSGFSQFVNNKRQLKKPSDYKDMKFRVQSGGLLDAVNKAMGAGSQTMAFADVYQALLSGAVDGMATTLNNIETQKFYEVAKYLTIGDISRIDYAVLTNIKFWDGLNQNQQKVFMDAMKQSVALEKRLSIELNENSLEIMKKTGRVDIYKLTSSERQEFKKALQTVFDQYAGKIGQKYVQYAQSLK